jgi:tetratricopeptide (TPR) repeat protein
LKPLLAAVAVWVLATAPVSAAAPPDSKDPKPASAPSAAALKAKAAEADSLVLLERAVARDSSKADNLYKLGVMYMDRDRPAEAVQVFTKLYAKRPTDARLLVNLGAAHDAVGHASAAQKFYREALKVAAGDSIASCRLAQSLYAGGQHQEAVNIMRGVIQHSPGAYCAYFTLGVAFADAGIYRDAIRMWKKVVELGPGTPEAVSAQESIDVLQKFVQQ